VRPPADPRGPTTLRGGAVLPGDALSWRFSRSSGPGGQSVNTADSRAELTVDLSGVLWASADQATRARERLAGRLRGDLLTVAASEHRSQLRNREAALVRVLALLDDALAPRAPSRRATRPSRASRERRAATERQRREVKSLRRRPPIG
jgi:ribosome-associated protein